MLHKQILLHITKNYSRYLNVIEAFNVDLISIITTDIALTFNTTDFEITYLTVDDTFTFMDIELIVKDVSYTCVLTIV